MLYRIWLTQCAMNDPQDRRHLSTGRKALVPVLDYLSKYLRPGWPRVWLQRQYTRWSEAFGDPHIGWGGNPYLLAVVRHYMHTCGQVLRSPAPKSGQPVNGSHPGRRVVPDVPNRYLFNDFSGVCIPSVELLIHPTGWRPTLTVGCSCAASLQ